MGSPRNEKAASIVSSKLGVGMRIDFKDDSSLGIDASETMETVSPSRFLNINQTHQGVSPSATKR